jgi:hypothetical protein
MANSDTYNKTTEALKQAGFIIIRNGRHEIWQSEDGKRGISISHNIRDKNRARSLLRSAGINDVRL